jgi:23S rRNA pseudouridine1911/1915/1917 synthase
MKEKEDILPEEDFLPEEASADEDSLYEHYALEASGGQNPLRVDKFLSNLLRNISRSRIKNASQTGSIKVNGESVKASYKVKPGDRVTVLLPFPPPPDVEAEDLPLHIVYEDKSIILINKAAGMVVHPAVGHRTGTLVHGLLWHFGKLPDMGEPARPGLVHRLDKDTSGIMLVAKVEFAMAHLGKQFFDRTTGREYQAIVWGDLATGGTIVGNVGRSPRDRKKFMVSADPDFGKHAVTHYEVLERFGFATLVKCKLETGRTHQIRVHMKHIGHTLFGDTYYDGNKQLFGPKNKGFQDFIRECLTIMPRQALHAKTLSFTHPETGERMSFDSELPEDFASVLKRFREWTERKRN